MDEDSIKMKKEEINQITNELKSHYLVEEFFVDPEKKFMGLLEKIIKFFEEDDFVICIKENEHLYGTFKKKYESAVDLIKKIESEKDKLQHSLKKISNNGSYYYNKLQKGNYYEGEESPSNLNKTADENSISCSPGRRKSIISYRHSSINSEFNFNEMVTSSTSSDPLIKYKIEYEKLKDEYFTLLDEKKFLESQLIEHLHYKSNYEETKNLLNSLSIQNENLTREFNLSLLDKNQIQERFNKIAMENFELIKINNSVKESLNLSEKERNNSKNKISLMNSKNKMLEKESNAMRKKTQTLNSQIKDLRDKLKDESDEKILMERRFEEIVEELENKLTSVEIEKQKMLKNSLSHLMESIHEDKLIEFSFNPKNNKIEIFFEKGKVGEVENNQDNLNEMSERSSSIINNNNNYNYYNNNFYSENKVMNAENSINYLKTDQNFNESNSPSKWKTNKKKLFGQYSEVSENNNISLNKLFSKSSHKSYADKENVQIFANQSNNSHNNILITNTCLSSNRRTEFSKLCDENENSNKGIKLSLTQSDSVNPFTFNDTCIKKTRINLNENLRYVFSSNNRHRKMISLDEAMGMDDINEEESRDNTLLFAKKLNFYSICQQNYFEIFKEDLKCQIQKNEILQEKVIINIKNFENLNFVNENTFNLVNATIKNDKVNKEFIIQKQIDNTFNFVNITNTKNQNEKNVKEFKIENKIENSFNLLKEEISISKNIPDLLSEPLLSKNNQIQVTQTKEKDENDHYVNLILYLDDRNSKLNHSMQSINQKRISKPEKPKASKCHQCMIL